MYTNESMLCNAFNNRSRTQRVIAMPPKVLDNHAVMALERAGYSVLDVNVIKKSVLRQAMIAYLENTDWSAFSRSDWDKAMAELEATA